jgi:hypothetical protein
MLRYDPETGVLFWSISPTPRIKIGAKAGSRSTRGYVYVEVDGHNMRANRIIFAMQTGRWPVGNVDHEDRDRSNNRWGNLREATPSQNSANSKVRCNNKLGFKGVTRAGSAFQASITHQGVVHYLGRHHSPEAAHAAYMAKAKELFGEFARAS